jgi:hypothetical protein
LFYKKYILDSFFDKIDEHPAVSIHSCRGRNKTF